MLAEAQAWAKSLCCCSAKVLQSRLELNGAIACFCLNKFGQFLQVSSLGSTGFAKKKKKKGTAKKCLTLCLCQQSELIQDAR